nr:hypothetical protein [Tanacetum cinerariifolium]
MVTCYKNELERRVQGECVFLEERGKECGFDLKEDEVVPKVDDVSLVDEFFDGALGGDGDEDFAKRDGNQSAFVPGRSISDNVLLTHELMHNYHLDQGMARCAFKVDIQKAYDTVDWMFLKEVLIGFGFHVKMVEWIMECVTTTSFSININGALHGVQQSDNFQYHRYCNDLELINLCFADDLFLFSHGDDKSAKVIMEALDEFKLTSGLVPSLPKSTAYFCNVLNCTKQAILQIMPFEEGRLLVKYLGFLLVPSRLIYKDCKELIEKVDGRINDWK